MAGEAALKGTVSEAVKDAYKALKERVAHWAGGDVEALEKSPTSAGRQAVVAEAINDQSTEEQAFLRSLADRLIAALKQHAPVGLDIGRLEALEVRLGSISVTEGTGARFREADVKGTFKTGPISVGPPAEKS